jgi:hypothetical protein
MLKAQGVGVREIARRLGRSPSRISRELRRNAATRGGKLDYRASVAQWKAELVARRPKTAKLATNDRLREYVQERLSGEVRRHDGTTVPGPKAAPWKGRGKPHRQDRRWATAWSPEQISARLKVDFPDDESMRISHEAIYQALYVQGRGALRRELTACLRSERAKGGSGADDLGMNTANVKNVRSLFERVGLDPFTGVAEGNLEKLEQLVKERGEIVHTGRAPKDFYKENAMGWRAFVDELAAMVDSACAAGAKI